MPLCKDASGLKFSSLLLYRLAYLVIVMLFLALKNSS